MKCNLPFANENLNSFMFSYHMCRTDKNLSYTNGVCLLTLFNVILEIYLHIICAKFLEHYCIKHIQDQLVYFFFFLINR